MNYYIAVIGIPILIILISYFLRVKKPDSIYGFVNFCILVTLFNIGYSFVLYFLNMEDIWDTGWAFYTIWLFSIPILIMLIIMHLIYKQR